MINGKPEQFLDTGWCTEGTLFYKGYIYWCEGYTDSVTGEFIFFVDKWKAENEDNLYYHSILNEKKEYDWERVYEAKGDNSDIIKKEFLKSPVFDGKSFWQIENDVAWLEDGGDIMNK